MSVLKTSSRVGVVIYTSYRDTISETKPSKQTNPRNKNEATRGCEDKTEGNRKDGDKVRAERLDVQRKVGGQWTFCGLVFWQPTREGGTHRSQVCSKEQ